MTASGGRQRAGTRLHRGQRARGRPAPGASVDAAHFKELCAHPAANGRGSGSKLADLIWYWVSPGAHMHQEQVETSSGRHGAADARAACAAEGRHDAHLRRRVPRSRLHGSVPADGTYFDRPEH
ncbi:hypothetical protein RB200_35585 [Streptomyces sp. PmtG]